jgi:hypothetical protein
VFPDGTQLHRYCTQAFVGVVHRAKGQSGRPLTLKLLQTVDPTPRQRLLAEGRVMPQRRGVRSDLPPGPERRFHEPDRTVATAWVHSAVLFKFPG